MSPSYLEFNSDVFSFFFKLNFLTSRSGDIIWSNRYQNHVEKVEGKEHLAFCIWMLCDCVL